MSSFADAVARSTEKMELKLETVLRKVSLGAFTEVILMSPVDTGRFRGNWNVAIADHIDFFPPSENLDPSGAGAIGAVNSMVAQLKAGDTVWLVNNLPYARRLEYGWSKQAPGGMVRLTAQRWSFIVEQAAKEVQKQ